MDRQTSRAAVFDDLKDAFRDLLSGNVAPDERRAFLHAMKDSLARARMALDDLRSGVDTTRRRLQQQRAELETVRRRKALAEGIGDAETVTIAARFEAQHAEHVSALERKLEGEEAELTLVESEVTEMTAQFKAAQAGVGSGLGGGAASSGSGPRVRETEAREAGDLDAEIDAVGRAQRRAALDADAEARLADLKRKMGM